MTMTRRSFLAAAGVCAARGLRAAPGAELHVSPLGRDEWSGRMPAPAPGGKDGPLATLEAARDRLRRSPPGAPRRIVVRGGKYFPDRPLVLDARDSGLVIEAAPGETPVLHGGRRVTGWASEGNALWAAPIPEGVPRDGIRMLSAGGRFAPRARLPESGYFTHLSEFDVRWMTTTGGGWQRKPTQEELTTLRFRPEDLPEGIGVTGAELRVYHMWDESMVGVASVDRAKGTLVFSNPAGHPPGAFGVRKYLVWNVREGIRLPGQWYADRDAGRIVYWPLPGEEMSALEVIAPALESILRIEGSAGEPVRDVAVRGLALTVTATPARAGGFGAGAYPGAIEVRHAHNCEFSGLEIFNAGGHGVRARDLRGVRFERCRIHDTGAGGLLGRGEDVSITDCRVWSAGLTYPSAIGIFSGGKNVTIAHNEVHRIPYSAVNCGGEGHRIEHNRLHHAMEELHDGAAIYSFAAKNLVMRGNFVHDIPDTGGYGSSAYYLDELSENSVVEGNLSLGVARPSHNHMAHGNAIRGNVFLHDGDMRLTFNRSRDFTFEGNVLSAAGRIVIPHADVITRSSRNIFHSRARAVEGAPEGTLLADPRLENIRPGQYAFAGGSPARDWEIPPIDVSGAGPRP